MSDTPTTATGAMQHQLDALRLAEAENHFVPFDPPTEPIYAVDYRLCVVGSLLTTRTYNFKALRHRMASL
ncbi:hypothetical protein LINGRAHAP2_LOCUS28769 [Linum grandiflorum]